MVYQEPLSALNPSIHVQDQLAESLITHRNYKKEAAFAESLEALKKVNMPIGRCHAPIPHQISGGQQQRVLIAMAMLNNPSLLIMDEPTTALDVTVEAAVLDLIAELQERYHTATLYSATTWAWWHAYPIKSPSCMQVKSWNWLLPGPFFTTPCIHIPWA